MTKLKRSKIQKFAFKRSIINFQIIHFCSRRTLAAIVNERFHFVFFAFKNRFHPPIHQVSHPTVNT